MLISHHKLHLITNIKTPYRTPLFIEVWSAYKLANITLVSNQEQEIGSNASKSDKEGRRI